MRSSADLLDKAESLGFRVVRDAKDVGGDTFELVAGGQGIVTGRSDSVSIVLVGQYPDRALLSALESELGGHVLLEVTSPEIFSELTSASESLESRLESLVEFDRVLVSPGQGALGERNGVRAVVPLDLAGFENQRPGLLDAGGYRWCVRRRPSGMLDIRRVVRRVPDLSDFSPPRSLVESISSGSGAFVISGGRGSGRSALMASVLLRVLSREGSHVVVVGEPWEYPVRMRGSIVEQVDVPWGDPVPEWVLRCGSGVDAVFCDLDHSPDLSAFGAPLVFVTSSAPAPGAANIMVSRSGPSVSVRMPGPAG